MNAYLLLDNGFKIEGKLFGHSKNLMGELTLSDNGSFTLNCSGSETNCILTEYSASVKKGNSVFFSADIASVSTMSSDSVPTLAKVIIDTLDSDYHMYDLKTFIPGTNLSISKKKEQKEAA